MTNMSQEFEKASKTAQFIHERTNGFKPCHALILGSGLGSLADRAVNQIVIPYAEIPNWPVSRVEGHAGNLVFGELEGADVVIMQGRAHYYEGWTPNEVTFPIRVFRQMEIPQLLVTNSAGGVNRDFRAGDLMLITDHLNLTGFNPLRGINDDQYGPRFPDMSHAYSPELRQIMQYVASALKLKLREGVYAGLSGPTYETPAEIRMLERLGADAVGMSTVPEVIVANHVGIEVVGISCITNMAAGISETKLSHDEVKETADRVREQFEALICYYLKELGRR